MRAFILTGPGTWTVEDVGPPRAAPGHVVVDIARVGVCGTDGELFSGEMEYLRDGLAAYPLRPGHEWCGTVSALGDGVDPSWLGRRTTGDTQIGCGRCHRCRTGRQHVCDQRHEIGLRRGFDGALAEQMAVPVTALLPLPDSVDDTAGAMVEPGGNALRAVRAADLSPGERLLVIGPGTIGLLAALFALAQGCEVHVLGATAASLEVAVAHGAHGAWTADTLPDLRWDAVIDASNAPGSPGLAAELVDAGRRIVLIGLSDTASCLDTRALVMKDVRAIGILSASPGLAGTIELYASGAVDPRGLVAATLTLDDVGPVLRGDRPADAGPGPKIHIDPSYDRSIDTRSTP
ncbi:zinc-dependent alcohol dehydrogenase [Aeromicrobium fastidiosum]|uniref:Alcohol dehydrogenase catalytic domain-containing protein n=1 Tax=Aeromicrobium fastidiosum TaxID=52699 RepID=A0A641ASC8_9ACTN|nr:alcohol dehydrogenase catalytic domain-containing protein [Aeromicrobium fastidiosum]KAA1380845.1 alcohol dehydrogenase catalytic domain-containing protein [Aeromicrobium fastidiosum]MBP2390473.1 threonine dehydrogenase-like Zn-dependent dehydrogenase [Aeromicrobium fastidiosum]